MADAEAKVTRRRHVSAIWLLPIVALLIGAWMVFHTLQTQGPAITIVFPDAEGIEEGETKVKVRNVEVGIVESAELGEDLKSVVVTARVDRVAEPLLREDTQFWVVRPRVGTQGVSGIGTLLSGAYIQLSPGSGEPGRHHFVGLADPPVTPAGTPGLRLVLVSETAGSVGTGNPVLYRGFEVGHVEAESFDVDRKRMEYNIFIEAPYDDLVSSNTRFWDTSGLTLRTSTSGIELDMASIETMLVGGVALGLPEGVLPGDEVADGTAFDLYASWAEANERPYRIGLDYVVRFPQSVRGLEPGAPVEYRGIPVGRVEEVMVEDVVRDDASSGAAIPIRIRLEPARLGLPDDESGGATLSGSIRDAVAGGMHATLATGNLLTGSLYVAMDFYPNEPIHELGSYQGRPTIPTVESGLDGLQVKLAQLLDKLNEVPIETLLARVEAILGDLEVLLGDEDLKRVPATLEATLADLREALASVSPGSDLERRATRTADELDRTLASLRALLTTLEETPSALIFDREPGPDPQPPAGAP